jgi:hypothetical protein
MILVIARIEKKQMKRINRDIAEEKDFPSIELN